MDFVSPVNQDFIWMAEYSDGSYLSEYDFTTKLPNNFYTIERSRVIRFGLLGQGMHLYYESFGGTLKLKGQMYQLVYKVGDEEYHLTGQPIMYSDLISYKDAESTARMTASPEGRFTDRIVQFNFGYKQQLTIKDVNFQVKLLCRIPYDKPAYLTIRLVTDRDLDGKLLIKRNGFTCDEFHAPLAEGVGGELNWIIK